MPRACIPSRSKLKLSTRGTLSCCCYLKHWMSGYAKTYTYLLNKNQACRWLIWLAMSTHWWRLSTQAYEEMNRCGTHCHETKCSQFIISCRMMTVEVEFPQGLTLWCQKGWMIYTSATFAPVEWQNYILSSVHKIGAIANATSICERPSQFCCIPEYASLNKDIQGWPAEINKQSLQISEAVQESQDVVE